MKRRKTSISILSAGLFFLAAPAFGQRDTVRPLTGSSVSGTIESVSAAEIQIDVNGTPRRIAVNEIESVSFAEDPRELVTARSRVKDGQFEDALSLINRIPPDTVTRDLIRQDLEFYRGLCLGRLALSGGGDKPAAAKALIDFLAAHPDSFHYYEGTEIVGGLAYAMNRYDAASEYYQKLAAAPWPEYQLRAKVLDAQALVAQQKFEEALGRFDDVIGAGVESAAANSQKTLARIGRAACLAEMGRADEGLQVVDAIIRDGDPDNIELFARAYNAQGLCHLKANRPKDALLAFLHVDLLFNSDYDSHAQALYYLSQLWTTVGRSDRAVSARSLLKSHYAGTVWASRE
jgi:tetratricopeptide (TPR) repeat protein